MNQFKDLINNNHHNMSLSHDFNKKVMAKIDLIIYRKKRIKYSVFMFFSCFLSGLSLFLLYKSIYANSLFYEIKYSLQYIIESSDFSVDNILGVLSIINDSIPYTEILLIVASIACVIAAINLIKSVNFSKYTI